MKLWACHRAGSLASAGRQRRPREWRRSSRRRCGRWICLAKDAGATPEAGAGWDCSWTWVRLMLAFLASSYSRRNLVANSKMFSVASCFSYAWLLWSGLESFCVPLSRPLWLPPARSNFGRLLGTLHPGADSFETDRSLSNQAKAKLHPPEQLVPRRKRPLLVKNPPTYKE